MGVVLTFVRVRIDRISIRRDPEVLKSRFCLALNLLFTAMVFCLCSPPLLWAQAVLENPQPDSFQSGIGVISGFVCQAARIEIEFDGETTFEAGYGTSRGDTQSVCGDTNNGFGLLFNWNLLGDGLHTVRALADEVEFAQIVVEVTTLGVEFLREVSRSDRVSSFPSGFNSVRVGWAESLQNFVIIGPSSEQGGTSGNPQAMLENPQQGSSQSGIGVISGFVCQATRIEIEFDGSATFEAAYGTSRGDTQKACGDTDNGFSLLFNWNLLGDGVHTVSALVDGAEFASVTVTVTTFGVEFLTGVSEEYTLSDFPQNGTNITLRWEETLQNFVIIDVSEIGTRAPVVKTDGQRFLLNNPSFSVADTVFSALGGGSWFIAADPAQTTSISPEERQSDGPGTGRASASFRSYAAQLSNLIAKYESLNLKVVRMWAFHAEVWQIMPSFVEGVDGTYDAAIDRRFDYAVEQFADAGIRVIIVLSNAFPDLGGNDAYVRWVRNSPEGDPNIGADPDAFYQHPLTRMALKNHIRRQLSRVNEFRGVAPLEDPVFFSFEIQNEPRCRGSLQGTNNLEPITRFLQEMSNLIRELDGRRNPKHLIGIGSEGLMNDGTTNLFPLDNGSFDCVDLVSQHALPEIDYITVHLFPNPNHNFGDGAGPGGDSIYWDGDGEDPSAITTVRGPYDPDAVTTVLEAVRVLANSLQKPVLVEEFGIQPFTDPFGLTTNTRDDVYRTILSLIVNDIEKEGPLAGGLVWQIVQDNFSGGDGFELQDIEGEHVSTAEVIREATNQFVEPYSICGGGEDPGRNINVKLLQPPDNEIRGLMPTFQWQIENACSDIVYCSELITDKGVNPRDGSFEDLFAAGPNTQLTPDLPSNRYDPAYFGWAVCVTACDDPNAVCADTTARSTPVGEPCLGVSVCSEVRSLRTSEEGGN